MMPIPPLNGEMILRFLSIPGMYIVIKSGLKMN